MASKLLFKHNTDCMENAVIDHHNEILVKWMEETTEKEFSFVYSDILFIVPKILKEMNLDTHIFNGKLGKKWLQLFMKKHPSMAKCIVNKVINSRSFVTKEQILNWFSNVESFLTENNVKDIFQNPSRVFNAEEFGFMMCPKGENILSIYGQKNIYIIAGNNEKQQISVLVNVSATSIVTTKMTNFVHNRMSNVIDNTESENWAVKQEWTNEVDKWCILPQSSLNKFYFSSMLSKIIKWNPRAFDCSKCLTICFNTVTVSCTENISTPMSSEPNNKQMGHNYLETLIDTNTLKQFKDTLNNNLIWVGPTEAKNLFLVWRKSYLLSGKTVVEVNQCVIRNNLTKVFESGPVFNKQILRSSTETVVKNMDLIYNPSCSVALPENPSPKEKRRKKLADNISPHTGRKEVPSPFIINPIRSKVIFKLPKCKL